MLRATQKIATKKQTFEREAEIERRTGLPPESERQRCEVWTRVMGYHRPVASFNRGKVGEFNERKFFDERSSRGVST